MDSRVLLLPRTKKRERKKRDDQSIHQHGLRKTNVRTPILGLQRGGGRIWDILHRIGYVVKRHHCQEEKDKSQGGGGKKWEPS